MSKSNSDLPDPTASSENDIEIDDDTAAFLKEKVRQYDAGELNLSEPMTAEDLRKWRDKIVEEAEKKSPSGPKAEPPAKPGSGPSP